MQIIKFRQEVVVRVEGDKVVSISTLAHLPRKGRPKKGEGPQEEIIFDAGGRLAEAVEFVRTYLGSNQRPSVELFLEALDAGLARKTVYRAARVLEVVKRPVGHGHQQEWMWSLPKDDKQTDVAQLSNGSASYMGSEREAFVKLASRDRHKIGEESEG